MKKLVGLWVTAGSFRPVIICLSVRDPVRATAHPFSYGGHWGHILHPKETRQLNASVFSINLLQGVALPHSWTRSDWVLWRGPPCHRTGEVVFVVHNFVCAPLCENQPESPHVNPAEVHMGPFFLYVGKVATIALVPEKVKPWSWCVRELSRTIRMELPDWTRKGI